MKKTSDIRRYNLLYNRYKMLALNMFTWDGLPPTIQERHIEKALFEYGTCAFYEDEKFDIGVMCLPCVGVHKFNVYGEALEYMVSGYGYNTTIRKSDKNVILFNNDLATPTREYVELYASKMANVEKSIDLNIKQQRIPWIAETTEQNKYSMQKAFEKILEGETVVYANKDLGINNSNVITLSTPFIALQLNEYKYELEREILTFLGLNNSYEKKERLLTDEVNSNNDFIEQNIEIMFKHRKKICEELNKKFGWNVIVKKAYTISNINNEVLDNE